MTERTSLATVVIGRNEGERLINCLNSLKAQNAAPIIYVDSGSTDASIKAAQAIGADVVQLDMSVPFTAARARNAGFARAREILPDMGFVQFIDGDCEVLDGWLSTAHQTIMASPDVAVVCGHQNEHFPEASIWNQLMDAEWQAPVGDTIACGGNAMMRRTVFEDVGGFREDLIAGEEPEMCFRMRQKGWRICRIDVGMILHDANIMHFSQWWKRCSRAGHAFAEGAFIHGASPERFRVWETWRGLIGGAFIPLAILCAALLITPWALLLVLIFPAQMVRLRLKGFSWPRAIFLTLGKFPEAQGAIQFHLGRLTGKQRKLIEYK